jgi:hypothetical protein
MFGSPGSSSAIDTLFHHIPDIKDQTNVPYANVDPLIKHIHYPDILCGHARGCTCPYQKNIINISVFLEQSAEPAPIWHPAFLG